jgi:hypothetical protein
VGLRATLASPKLTGSVGINVTSPESALVVFGAKADLPVSPGIHMGMDSSATAAMELCSASTATVGYIDFTYPSTDFRGRILYDHGGNTLQFSAGAIERMRLTSTGMGVGTPTPTSMLHVLGTGNITGNTIIGGTLGSTGLITGSAGLAITGNVGIGVAAPTSALSVCGAMTDPVTQQGVHAGTISNMSLVSICGAASGFSSIYFTVPGQPANSPVASITLFAGTPLMSYAMAGAAASYMVANITALFLPLKVSIGNTSLAAKTAMLDVTGTANITGNVTLNSQLTIGDTVTRAYSLYVNGTTYFTGRVDIQTSQLYINGTVKAFDIVHPNKDKAEHAFRLRHRCVESDVSTCLYKYQFRCNEALNTFDLPDYFQHLLENCLVVVSPFKHFGAAWGETSTDGSNKLYLTCSAPGLYNVFLMGDRKDKDAVDEFSSYGIEYRQNIYRR